MKKFLTVLIALGLVGSFVAGCAPEAGAEEGAETPAAADEAMGEGEGE
jgi:hypothetical protein